MLELSANDHFPGVPWVIDVDLARVIPSLDPRDGLNRHIFVHFGLMPCRCPGDHSTAVILVDATLREQVTMHDVVVHLSRIGYVPNCRIHRRFIGLSSLPANGPGHYQVTFKFAHGRGQTPSEMTVIKIWYVIGTLLLIAFLAFFVWMERR